MAPNFFGREKHLAPAIRLTDRSPLRRKEEGPCGSGCTRDSGTSWNICYKLCREESRAEDLTQEVFLKALQNRELLDSFNQRQCKAWLFATARNLYCDQLRRKMKEESLMREMLPEGDEEPPDETAEAALGTVDLETLLELLDPLDRAMFTLLYEEGYNASELSKIFHLPPGTVRTRLRKARTLLKHELLEE